jgi:hypothetical protein
MKKEDPFHQIHHPMLQGIVAAQSMIESVLSLEQEDDKSMVDQLTAEMESAKSDLKEKYPTYPELLEASARLKVMSLQAFSPMISVVKEYFERLIKASATLPDAHTHEPVGSNDIESFMKMMRDSVETMSNVHLNKVRREQAMTHIANGSAGAKARAEKNTPLKMRAIELALAGNYESRNQAAYQIAPKIAEMPEFKWNGMSVQSAKDTVARWLKEAGIEFNKPSRKRAP